MCRPNYILYIFALKINGGGFVIPSHIHAIIELLDGVVGANQHSPDITNKHSPDIINHRTIQLTISRENMDKHEIINTFLADSTARFRLASFM